MKKNFDFFGINFNSIKVRLKLIKYAIEHFDELNFNSIKVRLKLHDSAIYFRLKRFQFHKGTIKTRKIKRCAHRWRISIP